MVYRLIGIVIILIISSSNFQSPVYAWFNRGLDGTLVEMHTMFNQRELVQLYDGYVHDDIKNDIMKLIDIMKMEKTDENKIALRLNYKNVEQYRKATSRDIIIRFFDLMKNPRYKQPSNIKNSAYLRIALSLSLLFAFLDNGMELVDRKIGFKCAILTYKGNNFTMKIYFYYQNGKWFLTDGRQCQ
ncbi:MAG: hypothetical protein Kow00102_08070 [Spirochaetota bacterium]